MALLSFEYRRYETKVAYIHQDYEVWLLLQPQLFQVCIITSPEDVNADILLLISGLSATGFNEK